MALSAGTRPGSYEILSPLGFLAPALRGNEPGGFRMVEETAELSEKPDFHPIAIGVGAAGGAAGGAVLGGALGGPLGAAVGGAVGGIAGAAAGQKAGEVVHPTPEEELAPGPQDSSSPGPIFHVGL
jgi:hypothetical protein